jgi:D-amino peptidase
MKILVSVDIEGVAGVFSLEQTRAGNPEYERARRLMTEEANAAIRGAYAGGATEVLVNDSHGHFRNLLPDLLDPRAKAVQGKPRYLSMMSGLEQGCKGVLLIGYHSRAQGRGVLAHTINSFAFARVQLNGQEFSEAGLYGALAGELGVPVLMGSGDDVFIRENSPTFPLAVWAQTKIAYGHSSGVSLSPEESRVLIAECAQRAVQCFAQPASSGSPAHPQPFVVTGPVTCLLTTQGPAIADLFCTLPMLRRLDGVNIEFSASTIQDTIRMLNSLSAMSAMLR